MPRIKTIPPEEATGLLKQQYDAAVRRAGRIFNVVRVQSLEPRMLAASVGLYQATMLGPGPLPRDVREMIATVVAREMDCFY